MHLSTKGRYGTRFMVDLAEHSDKGPVLLKEIADRQDISEKYLWHLASILKSAGLVKSIRGARGGYVLGRDAAAITLKDIVVPLEGSLCLVACVDDPTACRRSETCATRDIWAETTRKVLDSMASCTLAQVVERQRKKSAVASYSI